MGKLKFILIAATAAALCACGGGSDSTLVGGGGAGTGGGGGAAAPVGTLTLLTSSPQIASDGGGNATISALVRDSNNNVMEGVSVILTASSGSLIVSQPAQTDASGVLTAQLSPAGDPTNRAITIDGIAGGSAQATLSVDVVGTTVQINGPGSIPLGATANYTVVVTDAGDNGVAGASVTLTSSAGNTLTPVSNATDNNGELNFTMTGGNGGADVITAVALGAQDTQNVNVSSDSFTFTTPDPAGPLVEVNLGVQGPIAVSWLQGAGLPVTFATSRGSFTDCAGTPIPSGTVNANGTGDASLCVTSSNAGPAVVTATNNAGTSIQAQVEFVATTPTNVELQVAPATVATNGQAQITAVVRDANGNLVKNQTVSFVLTDVTGGSLSVAQAITNSQGRAQTVYNASATTSALDGVRIDASLQAFPGVTNFETLTVAQRELFISIGTGNEIDEPNTAQYRKEWIVQISDAQGNGVGGASVTFSVLSELYHEGYRSCPLGCTAWTTVVTGSCTDEDILTGNPAYDRNGVLDPGEDNNGSGRIEAGNIASAVAQGGGSTIVTDSNGFGIIDIYWPQEYAFYLDVTLEVRASVQGSESAESTYFTLTGSASDFSDPQVAPPGPVSAFGQDGICSTPAPL